MSDPHAPSTIRIVITVHGSLARLTDPNRRIGWEFRHLVERGLGELLATLGISGQLIMSITAGSSSQHPFYCVTINDELLRSSDETNHDVWEHLRASYTGLPDLRLWSDHIMLNGIDSEFEKAAAEFYALAVVETVKQSPEVLFGIEQTRAWLRYSDRSTIAKQIQIIFRSILKQKVSIANAGPIFKNLQLELGPKSEETEQFKTEVKRKAFELFENRGGQTGHEEDDWTTAEELVKWSWILDRNAAADIAETAVSIMKPTAIEILINPDYLNELAGSSVPPIPVNELENSLYKEFDQLSDAFFYRLGIRIPETKLVHFHRMRQNSFAIRVNHILGVQRLGLRHDQLFVKAHPDALKAYVTATLRVSPYGSVISIRYKNVVESAGFTCLNPIGFILLALKEDLMRDAPCLIDVDGVEHELALLQQIFPQLVEGVYSTVSLSQLTESLRQRLAEGKSLRNLHAILEEILFEQHYISD